jgi:SAM-dependent methyltransferase
MTRADWADIAKGWEHYADAFRVRTMPVAAWMVDAIAPQPGQTLVDLAAGVGDTGFLAAELIEPGGTLITSDSSPEMLSAAQRRAEQLGITNVRFKQIDATQPIDIAAATIDGVLCRWGYMLMDDPEAGLRETRRILKPGGRVALAAWTGPDENRWSTLPSDLLLERGLIEPLEPGRRGGQFDWAEEGVVAENLEAVGFVEYEVTTLDFPITYASVQQWWDTSRSMGARVSQARVPDESEIIAALADAAKQWTAEDGSIAVPARTWVAVGTA